MWDGPMPMARYGVLDAPAGFSYADPPPGWKRFCDQIGADPMAFAAAFIENVESAMQAADAAYEALQDELDQTSNNERTVAEIANAEFEALVEAWEGRTQSL